jgi:hypothetical protein
MANRITNQFMASLEKSVVKLYATLTIGASGAVSSFQGGGIESIVKESGDGLYTITTEDKWSRILSVQIQHVGDTASDVKSWSVDTAIATLQSGYASSKEIALQGYNATGTEVNPASGEAFIMEITMRHSSYGPFDA